MFPDQDGDHRGKSQVSRLVAMASRGTVGEQIEVTLPDAVLLLADAVSEMMMRRGGLTSGLLWGAHQVNVVESTRRLVD